MKDQQLRWFNISFYELQLNNKIYGLTTLYYFIISWQEKQRISNQPRRQSINDIEQSKEQELALIFIKPFNFSIFYITKQQKNLMKRSEMRNEEQALLDYEKAIELHSRNLKFIITAVMNKLYITKLNIIERIQEYALIIITRLFNQILMNVKLYFNRYNRDIIYNQKGNNEQVFIDYNKALLLDFKEAKKFIQRNRNLF
ncbi:unnamed protein product [Paramecium primaurelia]|uniref:Uncharacterized protein n=1 Tax=Paramecium primaurelia TaxID=5886 RepID=A0A8S1QGU2_PARPR|nr:unnamed protein product [Paramecium primaurelia]